MNKETIQLYKIKVYVIVLKGNAEKIEGVQKADAEQNEQIEKLQKANAEQDRLLELQVLKEKEHEQLLAELRKQDEIIHKQVEENTNLLKCVKEDIQKLENYKIEKQKFYVSMGLAVIALLLSIIQYFI